MTSPLLRDKTVYQLALNLIEAWNSHKIEKIMIFYDPDYEGIDVADATPQKGVQGGCESFTRYLRAFPDLYFVKEEVIAQKDRFVLHWSAMGTHLGVFMKIPPTHRQVSIKGISLLTVSNHKITHGVHMWDVAGLLRSLGLLPEL